MTAKIWNSRHAMRVLILLVSAALAACASQPDYASFRAIPTGTVVRVNTPETLTDMPNVRSTGESTGKYAAAGMGKGAAGGAAAGFQIGIACGPFIIICSPVLALAGAGVGAVFGGIGGSIVGAIKGLPKDKADAFEGIIAATMDDNDPSRSLRDAFVAQGGHLWAIADRDAAHETSDVSVTIELGGFSLQQFKGDRLALRMRTTMVVRYGPRRADRTRTFLFDYESRTRHIDEWIDDEDPVFQQEIEDAYSTATSEMIAALTP